MVRANGHKKLLEGDGEELKKKAALKIDVKD